MRTPCGVRLRRRQTLLWSVRTVPYSVIPIRINVVPGVYSCEPCLHHSGPKIHGSPPSLQQHRARWLYPFSRGQFGGCRNTASIRMPRCPLLHGQGGLHPCTGYPRICNDLMRRRETGWGTGWGTSFNGASTASRTMRRRDSSSMPRCYFALTALVTPGHGIDMDYSSARRHNRRSGD